MATKASASYFGTEMTSPLNRSNRCPTCYRRLPNEKEQKRIASIRETWQQDVIEQRLAQHLDFCVCLLCGLCRRRLPCAEERRWVDVTRERLGQDGLEAEYAREKRFCVCPEKDLGRSGNEASQWRRKRMKLTAVLVVKSKKLERSPQDRRVANFVFKSMSDWVHGKRLRDDNLERMLRRLRQLGDKVLYEWMITGNHREAILSEVLDIPLCRIVLKHNVRRYRQMFGNYSPRYRNELSRWAAMQELLGSLAHDSSFVVMLHNSQYPFPEMPPWFETPIQESVRNRLYDEDFSGDPWDDGKQDPDLPHDFDYDYIDGLAEAEASDPKTFALEAEMEAASAAEPGMSDSELRDKVYWEHPEHRANPLLQIDWYKTCDALLIQGLLGIGGESLPVGVRYPEFVDLRNYIYGVLSGNRFALRSLDRYKRSGNTSF
jgi:hypothetical protein